MPAAYFVGGLGGYERLRGASVPDEAKRVEHPIFYPDSLAGRPPLIVDELYFDHFVGWDLDESDAVRTHIHRHTYAEKNTYVHDWEVGDLIMLGQRRPATQQEAGARGRPADAAPGGRARSVRGRL